MAGAVNSCNVSCALRDYKRVIEQCRNPLHPTTQSAYEIFLKIKDEYGMWICPNDGSMKDSVFRVGHIGYLKKEDYDKLIAAFEELRERRVI